MWFFKELFANYGFLDFGLIETNLKNGPTGNAPLPVSNSKNKSGVTRGIKFSICQYMVSWGFQDRESRNPQIAPNKNHLIILLWIFEINFKNNFKVNDRQFH
jgi:hypothetical protein